MSILVDKVKQVINNSGQNINDFLVWQDDELIEDGVYCPRVIVKKLSNGISNVYTGINISECLNSLESDMRSGKYD